MPETSSRRLPEQVRGEGRDPVAERVWAARAGIATLLQEAEQARRQRADAVAGDPAAVCAWNHFENIPTFYNWNNRPR
jgi:hypothetical protein